MTRVRVEFLHCRDTGHRWDTDSFATVRRPFFGTRRVLRCDWCGARRIEIIDSRGEVATRSYRYEDGYKTVTGLSKNEARAAMVRDLKRAAKEER